MSIYYAKQDLMSNFKTSDQDTASAPVQIALLTERLKYLNEHFNKHKKDHHSRRGLLKLVGRRRKLLNYLQKKNAELHKKVVADLGIRVSKTKS